MMTTKNCHLKRAFLGKKLIQALIKDIRYFEMMIGIQPKKSSPQIQQDLDLNKDATWHNKNAEGKKLKDK